MIRRPPRSTQGVSSAASDVYKRQIPCRSGGATEVNEPTTTHPTILAETADILKNSQLLEEKQRRDAVLEPILTKLRMGEIGGEYLLDDEGLLWYAPKGEDPKLVIPRVMVPGVLALVHSTFGHPGVARTTLLVQGKYNWPTLVRDCLLYTSPSPRDQRGSRMPSSA